MQQYWNVELLKCNHSNGVTTEVKFFIKNCFMLGCLTLIQQREKPEMF